MTTPNHTVVDREVLTQALTDLDQQGDTYHFVVGSQMSAIELHLVTDGETPGHEDIRVLLHNGGDWEVMSIPAPIKLENHFSAFNQEFALAEGWGMWGVDGRYALCRDDDTCVFESDGDAILFVAAKAADSPLHKAAIMMIGSLVE